MGGKVLSASVTTSTIPCIAHDPWCRRSVNERDLKYFIENPVDIGQVQKSVDAVGSLSDARG